MCSNVFVVCKIYVTSDFNFVFIETQIFFPGFAFFEEVQGSCGKRLNYGKIQKKDMHHY